MNSRVGSWKGRQLLSGMLPRQTIRDAGADDVHPHNDSTSVDIELDVERDKDDIAVSSFVAATRNN